MATTTTDGNFPKYRLVQEKTLRAVQKSACLLFSSQTLTHARFSHGSWTIFLSFYRSLFLSRSLATICALLLPHARCFSHFISFSATKSHAQTHTHNLVRSSGRSIELPLFHLCCSARSWPTAPCFTYRRHFYYHDGVTIFIQCWHTV